MKTLMRIGFSKKETADKFYLKMALTHQMVHDLVFQHVWQDDLIINVELKADDELKFQTAAVANELAHLEGWEFVGPDCPKVIDNHFVNRQLANTMSATSLRRDGDVWMCLNNDCRKANLGFVKMSRDGCPVMTFKEFDLIKFSAHSPVPKQSVSTSTPGQLFETPGLEVKEIAYTKYARMSVKTPKWNDLWPAGQIPRELTKHSLNAVAVDYIGVTTDRAIAAIKPTAGVSLTGRMSYSDRPIQGSASDMAKNFGTLYGNKEQAEKTTALTATVAAAFADACTKMDGVIKANPELDKTWQGFDYRSLELATAIHMLTEAEATKAVETLFNKFPDLRRLAESARSRQVRDLNHGMSLRLDEEIIKHQETKKELDRRCLISRTTVAERDQAIVAKQRLQHELDKHVPMTPEFFKSVDAFMRCVAGVNLQDHSRKEQLEVREHFESLRKLMLDLGLLLDGSE